MQVAEVALSLDQIALVGEVYQRVADRGIAVRVELHAVTDDVRNLDELAVVVGVK